MSEKRIKIKNELGIREQRHLIELTRGLMAALTYEEFMQILTVYNGVADRLMKQAKKEGIEI
ncbi:MAG: hypothetical protein DBY38_12755 [Clostridium cadaveris]|uniref:Uncharacterized protein n=1 Tax=Clostridium cadaveris TaxID=1529 RepID=A0A316M3K0_9CLOT|nr:MAG: hypothetical protein DBY38_12755 [Clostridium cadaveris]